MEHSKIINTLETYQAAKPRTQRAMKEGTLPQPTLRQGRQVGQERSRPMGELMKEEAASRKTQQLQWKEP